MTKAEAVRGNERAKGALIEVIHIVGLAAEVAEGAVVGLVAMPVLTA